MNNKITWSILKVLNEENVNESPDEAGVYRLSYKSADSDIYVFYVDKADKSLRDSLKPFLKKITNNPCIKTFLENLECYFKFAIVNNAIQRENIIKTLYSHYTPKCNLEIPKGEIIEGINFN